jgi:hypothetical protein
VSSQYGGRGEEGGGEISPSAPNGVPVVGNYLNYFGKLSRMGRHTQSTASRMLSPSMAETATTRT